MERTASRKTRDESEPPLWHGPCTAVFENPRSTVKDQGRRATLLLPSTRAEASAHDDKRDLESTD
jgi:hypothetical protein